MKEQIFNNSIRKYKNNYECMKYKFFKFQLILFVNYFLIFENFMVIEISIVIKFKWYFECCIFIYNIFCIFIS